MTLDPEDWADLKVICSSHLLNQITSNDELDTAALEAFARCYQRRQHLNDPVGALVDNINDMLPHVVAEKLEEAMELGIT